MKNAELAAHFAALPPDENAEIWVISADTGVMNVHAIELTTEQSLEGLDDADDRALGQPHVLEKW